MTARWKTCYRAGPTSPPWLKTPGAHSRKPSPPALPRCGSSGGLSPCPRDRSSAAKLTGFPAKQFVTRSWRTKRPALRRRSPRAGPRLKAPNTSGPMMTRSMNPSGRHDAVIAARAPVVRCRTGDKGILPERQRLPIPVDPQRMPTDGRGQTDRRNHDNLLFFMDAPKHERTLTAFEMVLAGLEGVSQYFDL